MQIPWPLPQLTKSELEPVLECVLKASPWFGWAIKIEIHWTSHSLPLTVGSWISPLPSGPFHHPAWFNQPGPLLLPKPTASVTSESYLTTRQVWHWWLCPFFKLHAHAFFGTTLSWFLDFVHLLFSSFFLGNFMDCSSAWAWNVSQDSVSHSLNKLPNTKYVPGIILQSRYWE